MGAASRLLRLAGVGLLVMVLCVAGFFRAFPPPRLSTMAGGSSVTRPADSALAWYFHSGQWRADARTFASMVSYLVSSEPAPGTNRFSVPA